MKDNIECKLFCSCSSSFFARKLDLSDHGPSQCRSRYRALVIHSYHMSKPTEFSFA